MDDPKDSPLRKAEESARRVLERLGSAIDKKVLGRSSSEFGADYAGQLASRIERTIESSLRAVEAANERVAPNYFKIRLVYEEASKLTSQQIESLSQALAAAAHEFIHNRRYQTEGPIQVDVVSDLFATATTVKAEFDSQDPPAPGGSSAASGKSGSPGTSEREAPFALGSLPRSSCTSQNIKLQTAQGRECTLVLIRGGAPLCIGRAAGNAIRLDDPSISRVHCSIALRNDGQIVISDLESANGTFVNGTVVNTGEAHSLALGDEIRVGDLTLKVGEQ